MAESLLAYLYTHIKGSQEDVATLSLQYILSSSTEITQTFNKFLAAKLHRNIPSKLQYICQSVGNDKERPDMAGIDTHGREKLLFEMKFYAALTENQPLTYLKRLKEEDGTGLVVICPQVRISSLWAKLLELCKQENVIQIDNTCAEINGIAMTILSWNEITELFYRLASTSCLDTSDIKQLDGYCKQMDSEAFIPFRGEDLGADVARREERYIRVVDELIDALCACKDLDTSLKGLKASPQRYGYNRYIKVNNLAVTISYNRTYWMDANSVDTPFWITIKDEEWEQNSEMKRKINSIKQQYLCDCWREYAIALIPLTNVTLTEIIEDMMRQVKEYIRICQSE